MPVLTVALPSLSFGFNQVAFARKVSRYFVVPLGLVSNAVSHPGHRSIAVTASSLLGVLCVTAATLKRLAARRNLLNAIGCVLMLGASYVGRVLERKRAAQAAQSKLTEGGADECKKSC